MDDVRAILDAVGSTKAALLGVSEGGPMCSLFAATYPEKTEALVMIGTYAKRVWEPAYPWAPTREARERFIEEIRQDWGGPVGIEVRAPSRAADPEFRDWWASYLRMGASPAPPSPDPDERRDRRPRRAADDAGADAGPASQRRPLPARRRRPLRRSLVPRARFVELPGADHLPFVGDQEALLDEIESFLAGVAYAHEHDRWLATVLSAKMAQTSGVGFVSGADHSRPTPVSGSGLSPMSPRKPNGSVAVRRWSPTTAWSWRSMDRPARFAAPVRWAWQRRGSA